MSVGGVGVEVTCCGGALMQAKGFSLFSVRHARAAPIDSLTFMFLCLFQNSFIGASRTGQDPGFLNRGGATSHTHMWVWLRFCIATFYCFSLHP